MENETRMFRSGLMRKGLVICAHRFCVFIQEETISEWTTRNLHHWILHLRGFLLLRSS